MERYKSKKKNSKRNHYKPQREKGRKLPEIGKSQIEALTLFQKIFGKKSQSK